MKRLLLPSAIAAFFIALTGLMTFPLSVAPGTLVINMGADTRLFLWTLAWDLHAVVHQPTALFDANIFFPNRNTLAYSENLLGVALLAAPWLALTGSLLTAMNAMALLSCVLSGLGAYTLSRQLKVSVAGALVAGVIFAFSPPRFSRLGQLHLTSVQWIPFCLAFLHAYLEGGKRRHLLGAAALFTLQALSSGHGAAFLAVSVAGLLAYYATVASSFSWLKLLRDLGIGGVLVLGVAAPLARPYEQVGREMGFERSLLEAEDGSPNAVSYLASPAHFHRFLLSWILPSDSGSPSTYLFPGYLTLILAAVCIKGRRGAEEDRPAREDGPTASWVGAGLELGAILSALTAVVIRESGGISFSVGSVRVSAHGTGRAVIAAAIFGTLRLLWARRAPLALAARSRRWRGALRGWSQRHGGASLSFYLPLALFTVWASAGPRLGLYALLYHAPGFNFIRIPSRIMIVTLLGLAVLAGAGFDRLGGRLAWARRPWFAAILISLLVAELATFPIKARPYVIEIPEADRWLATQPRPFVIAEVPVADPDNSVRSDRLHSLYMLHSMAHWEKTVSGYSGSRPLRHAGLYKTLMGFPDEASIGALRDFHVTYVVVHRDLYPPGEVPALDERLRSWEGPLRLEHSEGQGLVYSLGSDVK